MSAAIPADLSEFIARLRASEAPEQLLLLEHPHVFTLGRGADTANILADQQQLQINSVEVHETGRGGDVTYHGPGQLVGYPIINLKPDRCDVHRYVRDIEEVLIQTIAEFGVTGTRIEGLTGVWVGNEKIGAIGVRIARWITSHGFALNVNTDLSYFKMIVPCGITDKGVTSLSRILGRQIELSMFILPLRFAECSAVGRVPGFGLNYGVIKTRTSRSYEFIRLRGPNNKPVTTWKRLLNNTVDYTLALSVAFSVTPYGN
jgi:lipoyl(octanoyl) transferase